jgi:hypothetical protein
VVPSNKRLIELGMKNPVANPFQSLGVFMRSPREVIAVMADIIPKRMRNFYFWPNFGFFDPVYLVNSCAYPNAYASHLEFYAIFVLFAGAAVFAVSKEVPIAHKALIAIPVIYYSLLHGVLFLSHSPRYKAPIDPFIAIIVSFGIRRMLKLLRGAE